MDVDALTIFFFSDGPPNETQKISLQVSDGQLTSQPASLRASVIPLNIEILNNTGAILPHQSSILITNHDLSLSSNADDPSLEFWFKIKEDCEFGVVEVNSNTEGNETWRTVDKFSYNDIVLGLVRYRHNLGNPVHDKFQFVISVNGISHETPYEFRITFIKLAIVRNDPKPILIEGVKELTITSEAVSYYTSPIAVSSGDIVFTIKLLPRFGNIYYESKRLILNDNFTQEDVQFEKIKYRMLRTAYVEIADAFEYDVTAIHCPDELRHSINMSYRPPRSLPFHVHSVINVIKVMEGGTTPIHSADLNIKVESIKSLVYEVFEGPHHGTLSLVDLMQNVTQNHIVHFTPSQIKAGRLMYSHDGTESAHDNIKFMAISNAEDDFMTVGGLGVNVTLINDNAPVRQVSSVFRIVKGGQRLLTTQHLKFSDADSDFNPNDLVYTIKNGSGIFSSITHLKLQQFTQGDLDEEKVVIVEKSLSINPIMLTVSDGTHTTDFYLDVRPSPPYVELTNNSHLVVSQGGQAIITTSNLYSDTNIDVRLQDIKYIVTSVPSHGELLVSGDSEVQEFKQGLLENGSVVYKHLSSSLAQDRLQLKIGVLETYTVGSLAIRVFPPIYWEPLLVSANSTIYVEEYTSVIIKSEHILVNQPGIPPSDITFLVVQGPLHGYLEIDGSEDEKVGEFEEKGGVRAFDQATINAGKLYYVQSATNESSDNFTVDVTNGVSWLRSLRVEIVVIPSKFYLPNVDLMVNEGGAVKLPDYLYVSATPHFGDKIIDYQVFLQPSCGMIVMFPNNRQVTKWSVHQIKNSVLKYIHDGSESYEDNFSIVARTKDKESEPSLIHITVIPENDMIPILVNKSSITIWQGGSETISNTVLATVDVDTGPSNLTYMIVSATGGHVAYSDQLKTSISRFSQEEINDDAISFVHDGGLEPFTMDVMIVDGKNKIGPITYSAKLAVPSVVLEINSGMKMFPLLRKQITSKMLFCSSSDDREITYTITKPPMLGQLIVSGSSIVPVSNFTQSDIVHSRLFYQHTTPFKELSLLDSFTFDVTADFVEPTKNNVFQIEVAVNYAGFEKLFDLSAASLAVKEGGEVDIQINKTAILDFFQSSLGFSTPALELSLIVPPQNGQLCNADVCNASSFTFSKYETTRIFYKHDHSDTLNDFFEFSLLLLPGGILLSNLSFVVDVTPVNDQPFELITKDPHISVVQGQYVHITKNDLITEDLDTGPEDIIYEIISGPNIGSIYLHNATTGTFTQQDINSGFVYYKHSGAMQPTSFYFRVSDGKFTPVYTVFHISVSKIHLNITVSKRILLKQGTNTAPFASDVLIIRTNANFMDIVFNVTSPPHHGKICINSLVVTNFSYFDIERGVLYYKQENMSSYDDVFELSALNILDSAAEVRNIRIHVKILPLVTIGEFSVTSGSRSKVDLSVLDASPLAKISNANPIFRVLKKPRYGALKKIIRSSGEFKKTREKEVSKFTHEELKSGLIYFFSKKNVDTVDDRILFLLYTDTCQPAVGELRFKIFSEVQSSTVGPLKTGNADSKVEEPDDVKIASPNMSDDYLLGVTLVTGVIALALLIVGFIKCGSKHTSYDDSVKSDLPDPLPRPPDDLMPSSPHIAISSAQILSPHVNSSGINNSSSNSSEHELNSRYPYGEEDWNSYSESVLPTKGNPMLRKNQYWV
uniref:Chondroitin sulfate proteoglycan 4 n=1 Tax=Lygus hesperus TaxID=30085 RepID=A0A0A9WLL9_LYGHE